MNLRTSPTRNFFISSLAVFTLLIIFLGYLIDLEMKNFIVKHIEEETVHHVRKNATDFLQRDVFTRPDISKNKGAFDDFNKAVSYLDSKRIKMYNSSGVIVYSDVPELIGKKFENEELEKALGGKPTGHIHSADADEHATEKSLGNFMEVYVPIYYENAPSPSGIVEVYFDIKETQINVVSMQKTIFLGIAASLIFLFLLLYWFFKKASETITEKNRVLSEITRTLKMAQDQDEAILESMGEGLIVVNNEGQVLLYNPKVEAVTGFSSQEVLYRHYKNFIDLRDKDGKKIGEDYIKQALKEGLTIKKTHREDIFIKNKEGEIVPVALTIAPIFEKDEKVRGLVFTIHDAKAEKELDKVKDEFVYVVAHELGNPIFTINGYLSMAIDGNFGKVSPRLKDSLITIQTVNQQLSTLVSDLLEVIRSESGQMKFKLEKIEISEIINEVMQGLSLKAKDKKIKLIYEKINLPEVNANRDKVKEVIINLVDNAIKYSPEKASVVVSHKIVKDSVYTQVKDSGFGMTENEKEHLFEKFYRIRNEETNNIEGTGLGLFIVKALVNKMDGEIWVETEKGKGSTFNFSLKIAKK